MRADCPETLIEKLRRFTTEELDDEERALFAALIAPGVLEAYAEGPPDDAEVSGFEMGAGETAGAVPPLAEALHRLANRAPTGGRRID